METNTIKVWDPLVRILHWSLVALFALTYLSGESEASIHRWAGYAILGIITIRFVWGFIGTKHARFSDFVRAPSAAFQYLRGLARGNTPRTLGHNPAGGWMTILLLSSLCATGLSGWKMYQLESQDSIASTLELRSRVQQAEEHETEIHHDHESDDLHDKEDESDEDFWEDIHEFFANFTVLLILLHIAGVLASSLAHGENLIKSMWTGYKKKQIT